MPQPRVPLVDDQPSIRLALRQWFEHNGWDVDEAGDGASACTQFDAFHTGMEFSVEQRDLPDSTRVLLKPFEFSQLRSVVAELSAVVESAN